MLLLTVKSAAEKNNLITDSLATMFVMITSIQQKRIIDFRFSFTGANFDLHCKRKTNNKYVNNCFSWKLRNRGKLRKIFQTEKTAPTLTDEFTGTPKHIRYPLNLRKHPGTWPF